MYTSSAPCGNATIKKFIKIEHGKVFENLLETEFPAVCHDPITIHSKKMGQVAFLFKKFKEIVLADDLENLIEEKVIFDKDEKEFHDKLLTGSAKSNDAICGLKPNHNKSKVE